MEQRVEYGDVIVITNPSTGVWTIEDKSGKILDQGEKVEDLKKELDRYKPTPSADNHYARVIEQFEAAKAAQAAAKAGRRRKTRRRRHGRKTRRSRK
jgi:hypothetical protein